MMDTIKTFLCFQSNDVGPGWQREPRVSKGTGTNIGYIIKPRRLKSIHFQTVPILLHHTIYCYFANILCHLCHLKLTLTFPKTVYNPTNKHGRVILVTCDLSIARYCTRVHWTRYQNYTPCITGQPVIYFFCYRNWKIR